MSKLCTCGHPVHDGRVCRCRIATERRIVYCRCDGDTKPDDRAIARVAIGNDLRRAAELARGAIRSADSLRYRDDAVFELAHAVKLLTTAAARFDIGTDVPDLEKE